MEDDDFLKSEERDRGCWWLRSPALSMAERGRWAGWAPLNCVSKAERRTDNESIDAAEASKPSSSLCEECGAWRGRRGVEEARLRGFRSQFFTARMQNLALVLLIGFLPLFVKGQSDALLPLWAAGENVYGALGVQNNLGSSAPNAVPFQLSDILWKGSEIVSVSTFFRHTMIQTAKQTAILGDAAAETLSYDTAGAPESLLRRTYRFGWNFYGQLGTDQNIGTNQGVPVGVLPRAMFPFNEMGNEVGPSDEIVSYVVWRQDVGPVKVNVTIPHGAYSGPRLAAAINNQSDALGHSSAWLDISYDDQTDRYKIGVRTGYQLDLMCSCGPASLLGFFAKIPLDGVVGEISARLGNNQLVFRGNVNGNSTEYTINFPDNIYSSTLQVLNPALFACLSR